MAAVHRLRGYAELLRSGRTVVLLCGLVVAAIGATAGSLICYEHRSAFEEHARAMEGTGIVLAEQTSRYAQVIDLTVQGVRSWIGGRNIADAADFRQQMGTREVALYLADCSRDVPQVSGIVLIDADGQTVNSSRTWPDRQVDSSDRDFYRYFKEHDDAGLFIGSLAKNRGTGNLSLFFARRVGGSDARFLGVVLGVVKVQYLSDFYRAVGEATREAVTLLRSDGTMLMRYPDPAAALGLPEGSPWYARVAAGGGSYVGLGIGGDIQELISVHPLREYPLVVNVVMEEATVFAQWHRDVVYISSIALTAAVAFAALFGMLARQFRGQAEQNARLEEASIRLTDGQEKLRAYAEMSADWFWEQDADFRFRQRTSPSFTPAYDDTGKTLWELAGTAMTEERWAPHKAQLAARLPFRNFHFERVGPDGARRFMTVSGDPVFDRNGTFNGYFGTGRDITGDVKATANLLRLNADLELGRQQFDAVLNSMSQGVCLFDREKQLLLCNRRYAEIYNLSPEATRPGLSLEEIVRARYASGSGLDMSPSEFLAWRDQVVDADQPATSVAKLMNGRTIVIYHQPMPGGGWVATHEDITERQHAEASIVFMAHHDSLTKLPNRVLFRERVEQALAMVARGSKFAMICLDLDNFKQVNDTLGHPVGDGLLVTVADRLTACVREGDTVARLGGDEFAIIQIGVGQPEDAELLTSRLIAAFRQPFEVAGHQLMSGTSIGVTMVSAESVSFETLMREADIALYLAKTEGRGTARFFEPEMDARIHMRRVLELELQGAIARNEFELYYQPQISLDSDKVCGFETLVRWNHPTRGQISPLDFIPVAEETGMIGAIGEWVLRTACFEAENWPPPISVAVNLSSVQFKKGDLVATVQAALAASGLRPHRLELEITESVFLRDTADTLSALHQLRAMGICVALDDFGTGYSSLSYLRSFPFSKIKIDKSFVRDLPANNGSMSIIRAVTGLGKSLGMKTLAEGVERPEQLDTLRAEGCDEVQGYLFSRPRPAGEIPSLIERLHEIAEAVDSVEI
jgi:diguanylate cyclase (GGDEF)-like protein/PAS domain S-box-containing protein